MKILMHKFVKNIPEILEENTIYVSIEYSTVIHKCCCGCGNEVVTPISPTDWKLIYDGDSVTLYPSIGNWNFECQSHYWIENNCIRWAPKWSKKEIEEGRKEEEYEKNKYYNKKGGLLFNIFKKNRY